MKKFVLASLLCASAGVYAQEVVYAKVLSVSPIESVQRSYEPVQKCFKVEVPVYRDVPVQIRVDTPVASTYRAPQSDSLAPVLGMLIGAAIGNRVVSGDARVAGTFLGATVGYALTDRPQTHTYVTTHSTYVTEFRKEFQGMSYRDECRMEYDTVSRVAVTAYNVTYLHNGVRKNITLNFKPGDYLRITTTSIVEP